jgi:hypothetical protein
MDQKIQEFLEGIKVGTKQNHKNMTLYCLLAAKEADTDFITLDEALDSGALAITELDDSGSVPQLRVRNKSYRKVLLLDGEEFVGAKQNRVLNVTILIAAKSETLIPVSCVEEGRWSYRSREFGSAGRAMCPKLRMKKVRSVRDSLTATGSFTANQDMVWDEIDAKFERMAAEPSPTMAMSDLYESHEDLSLKYLKAFKPVDKQIGMAVFIDGHMAGVELLCQFDAFTKSHAKLVQSYVMDALETAVVKVKGKARPSKTKATGMLQSAAMASVERRQSVALGEDVRLEADDLMGAGLAFESEIIQISIFLKSEEETSPRSRSMRRASDRAIILCD